MEAGGIAKNLLLDRTCNNCSFSDFSVKRDANKCTLPENVGKNSLFVSLPKENTCNGWHAILSTVTVSPTTYTKPYRHRINKE